MSDLLDLPEAAEPAQHDDDAVAPWPHTAFMLAVLAMWALYGAMRSRAHIVSSMPRPELYAGQMMLQYMLVGTTIAGLYHRRHFLRAVLGDFTTAGVLTDLGQGFLVYLGGWAVTVVLGMAVSPIHLAHDRSAVLAIAPHSALEMLVWVGVSVTAGVCEEFVFRGYLLRQFTRWLHGATSAIALSAVLFACMHFYEGAAAVVQIGGLGAFYAYMAVRRGHLRHVMIAHFLQDALTGLYLFSTLARSR